MNKYQGVSVCGSIAFDRIMSFEGDLTDHLSSSTDVSISLLCNGYEVSRGGTGANIAYYLGVLEVPTSLVGAVGPDANSYMNDLNDLGINTSQIQKSDNLTATFHGLVDNSGRQIGSFFPGAMKDSQPLEVSEHDLVIISAHDPEEMSQQIKTCHDKGINHIYDPAQQVSVLAVNEIETGLKKSLFAIFNSHELEIVMTRLNTSIDRLLKTVPTILVTNGAKGSTIYDGSEVTNIPAVQPTNVLDPTGAGDAYRAGLLSSLCKGASLAESAKFASTVASFAVEVKGGQNQTIKKSDIIDRHNSTFGKGDSSG